MDLNNEANAVVENEASNDVIQEQKPETQQEEQPQITLEQALSSKMRVESEAKKFKDRAFRAERELDSTRKRTLEEQQQYKELANTYKQELETLRTETIKTRVKSAIESVAKQSGCIDTDAVSRLGNADLIQYDDSTGQVIGTELFIADLKKNKPYLFKAGSQSVINPTVPSAGVVTNKKVTAADIAKMPQQERNKYLLQMFKK